jgi:hypothetical protein
MSHSKPFRGTLFERVKKNIFFVFGILSSAMFTILIVATTSHQQIVISSNFDSTTAEYSTIPLEYQNIFKGKRYTDILNLRKVYLSGERDTTSACQYEFEELKEVCRQVFGSFSPSENAMLVRGIMTANGVYHPQDSIKQTYTIGFVNALGIEIRHDLDLTRRMENQPDFSTIMSAKTNRFHGRKRLELYPLRQNYLDGNKYLTNCFDYTYNELSDAYKQACGAYSPSFNALLVRGTLTAHGQYKGIDSTHSKKFKLMTPAKMGLKLEDVLYARIH